MSTTPQSVIRPGKISLLASDWNNTSFTNSSPDDFAGIQHIPPTPASRPRAAHIRPVPAGRHLAQIASPIRLRYLDGRRRRGDYNGVLQPKDSYDHGSHQGHRYRLRASAVARSRRPGGVSRELRIGA